MTRKIIFIIDDLRSGGAQKQLIALAESFRDNEYSVEIVYYFKHDYYLNYLHENKIKATLIEEKKPIKRIIKIRRHIREHKPDGLIAFMVVPILIGQLTMCPPIPGCVFISGERSSDPKILTSVKSRIVRLLHFFSSYVVANSSKNIEIVKKVNPFLSNKKLITIYNSIDLEKFRPSSHFRFRKNGYIRIIVPASYRRLKNPLGLIEALHQLSEYEKKQIRIDWFGDKAYESHSDNVLKECEINIQKNRLGGIIQLNDVINNISEKMPEYDVVGLFSFYEGLPNTVCEGMACGKPILCTKVSDLPVLIRESENGYLCEANDVGTIKKAIQRLISTSNHELTVMGKNNRVKARQLFDKSHIFKQYKNLLH